MQKALAYLSEVCLEVDVCLSLSLLVMIVGVQCLLIQDLIKHARDEINRVSKKQQYIMYHYNVTTTQHSNSIIATQEEHNIETLKHYKITPRQQAL